MIVVAALVAWWIGSLPAVRLVERLWRTDLRRVGTGNTGAGNATRSIGLHAGAVLAVLDGLKGLVPVVAARQVGFSDPSLAAIGLAAVAGNNWPVWRRDRGGRGLATSAGVVVGFAPWLAVWPGIWAVAGWMIGGGVAGFVGWAMLPAFAAWFQPSGAALLLAAGLGAMMATRRAQGNSGLESPDLLRRVVFDDDPRPVVAPSRPLAVSRGRSLWLPALLVVGFPTYLWLAGSRATDLSLAAGTVALLLAAALTELGAKFAFGALYRQGASSAGVEMSPWTAFRAALVGTGVARLIPAGGVVTPVAMAWSANKGERTAGAAVRATVLSYGGLAGATGIGLLWASLLHPPGHAARTTGLTGLVLLALGAVLIGLGGRLRHLVHFVPSRWRARVAAVLVDHSVDRRAWGLITARTLLEAATLGLTLIAFGISMAPSQVVAAFGVSQIVGGLPGSPGGLGVTEAGLIGVLVLFGIPAAVATTPVLTFRIISYWLPAIGGLAFGGHAYLSRRET
jgi:acyl phosphate:glycerol-3-phosphate acyltransferase